MENKDKRFKIEWAEVSKNGSTNGRAWQIMKMSLTDEDGVKTEGVSTFETVSPGMELEGKIVTNDKGYLNFVKKLEAPQFMKKPNMDRIMEKKQAGIAESQEKKAQNIEQAQDRSAWMWARTNASTILANRQGFASMSNNEIADQVLDLATIIYNGEPLRPFE